MKKKANKLTYRDFEVVDLFCGVGGLSHGFVKEKFNVKAGIDFDNSCRYAFENNNKAKFLHRDIKDFSHSELLSLYGNKKKKILVGCAPCQPFSIYNRNSSNSENRPEDKWKLLYSFSNLIDETEPEIISMENVPLVATFEGGKVFNDFINRLEAKNYLVSWSIVNAQDYGVAQRRKRLILFGSKLGEKISLVEPTIKNGKYKTVKDAIGHLPNISDGESHPKDPLHYSKKLNDLNKERIQATPEGGSWKDWDERLWLDCHKKESGKNFGSVYGRMKWNEVAPTMTTYCIGLSNGRFGHPEQDRAISLREAALIQSFPEDYNFIDPNSEFSSPTIARQIGNAVPVGLGIAVAKSIKNHIKKIERNKQN
ncbi:DNA cytosine methyltransferase [Flavobacterium psychrophilum]|uniref:DNA cytosine methyltransferase n=1 Tax=Flavobacterium psychrophilum TaxID=96345 RepID=UPI001C8FA678|nr:DNA (cytosine-5-)-methyltransferase [Flavobacterium psychrophilum]QZK99960.1 DNA cytosine methyltransferase [Flavobacterium psychrophilum]